MEGGKGMNDRPDVDCYTLPNGECVSYYCTLHGYMLIPSFKDQVRAAERRRNRRVVVAWRLVLIVVWVVVLVAYLANAQWGT